MRLLRHHGQGRQSVRLFQKPSLFPRLQPGPGLELPQRLIVPLQLPPDAVPFAPQQLDRVRRRPEQRLERGLGVEHALKVKLRLAPPVRRLLLLLLAAARARSRGHRRRGEGQPAGGELARDAARHETQRRRRVLAALVRGGQPLQDGLMGEVQKSRDG